MTDYDELLEKAYSSIKSDGSTGERFEIPKLDSFTEGNKTIVKNFGTVVDSIRRKREELVKYLSKELAVPASLDADRLILQRKFFGDLINKKFEDYVNTYVICKQCRKPDTHIEAVGHVKMVVCEACGAKNPAK
ncbi:translation initiation factor IF-2 subunit beta [Candidatus Micrarchaeota archaeon]|nr:translation initiation factor IF-2 subunit beta [Candidatus Micrarchaeota archaeon]